MVIQKTNSGMFQVGQDNVVKEFPKLNECGWAEDELDTDVCDMEPFTPKDVESGEVMYLVECGHVFRTSQFLLSFPNPLIRIIPYDTVLTNYGRMESTARGPPQCPVCRRLIAECHVRLLPREAFRKQYYSAWYATLTAVDKTQMEAEWQSNQRKLAPYGLYTNTPDNMVNIIFPPNAIPPPSEEEKAQKKAAAAAEARKKAAVAAAAAGGALLGLVITHSLYRHMVRTMKSTHLSS